MIIMKMKCIIIPLLLSSGFYINAHSQTQEEITAMRKVFIPEKRVIKTKERYKYATENNSNEISWIFSTLFLAYKTFVSSQDQASCTFIPSCSEYGMLAVKKQGVIIGVINTFDRLSRCNGLSPELYERDTKTHLYVDPL